MLKFLTFLALLGFAWWRIRRLLVHRRLRRRGLDVPQEKGLRPIAVLAGLLLVGYGGYMLWHLFGAVSASA